MTYLNGRKSLIHDLHKYFVYERIKQWFLNKAQTKQNHIQKLKMFLNKTNQNIS